GDDGAGGAASGTVSASNGAVIDDGSVTRVCVWFRSRSGGGETTTRALPAPSDTCGGAGCAARTGGGASFVSPRSRSSKLSRKAGSSARGGRASSTDTYIRC